MMLIINLLQSANHFATIPILLQPVGQGKKMSPMSLDSTVHRIVKVHHKPKLLVVHIQQTLWNNSRTSSPHS